MQRRFKALRLLAMLAGAFLPCGLLAQGTPADCPATRTFTAAGVSTALSNKSTATGGTPCNTWALTYYTQGSGTVSGLSIQLETAPDANGVPGSWTAVPNTICSASVQPPCLVYGSNPLTSTGGQVLTARAYTPWLRVNLGTFTKSGSVTVFTRLYGYKGAGGGGGGGTGFPGTVTGNNISLPGNLTIAGTVSAGAGQIPGSVGSYFWVPTPASFTDSLIVGNGGASISRTGTNPVDPLANESNGASNGLYNTFVGIGAGLANTTGNGNVFVGSGAGQSNTNGDQNTYTGWWAGRDTTSGYHNSFYGVGAGQSVTTGYFNIIIGSDAGLWSNPTNSIFIGSGAGGGGAGVPANGSMVDSAVYVGASAGFSSRTGNQNVCVGALCEYTDVTGTYNVGLGYKALFVNTVSQNTAIGYQSLYQETTGGNNTSVGFQSSPGVTTGANNVSVGSQALYTDSVNSNNTAVGTRAIFTPTGSGNTAVGFEAAKGAATSTASNSTAVGYQSLFGISSGANNSAFGEYSGYYTTTGGNNVAIGWQAGVTAVAANANTTGSSNTWLGYNAGPGSTTQRTFQTVIGAGATGDCSSCVVLGRTTDVPVMPGAVATPASASAACVAGQFAFNTGFIYVCIATNTWLRAVALTW